MGLRAHHFCSFIDNYILYNVDIDNMHQILLNLISIKEMMRMHLTHVNGSYYKDELGRIWKRSILLDTYKYELTDIRVKP